MTMIDPSREVCHRTPTDPSHPPVVTSVWNDHSEIKLAGATRFTSKALRLCTSDHTGTLGIVPGILDGAFAIDPLTGVVAVADGRLLDLETRNSRQTAIQVAD